jgi:hypothetical protein
LATPKQNTTYQLNPADTLTSVSEFLGIDEFELKHYHNNHCKNGSYIINSLPQGLKEIIIPPYVKIPKPKNKIIEDHIAMGAKWSVNEKYKVRYHWLERADDKTTMNSFSKAVTVEAVLKEGFLEVLFLTEDATLEKEKDDWLQMEEIAQIMSGIYKKVRLHVLPDGTITEIVNLSEIKSNWNIVKSKLLTRNGNSPEDKITDYIIESVDEEVKSRERMTNSLKYDYSYNFLLKGILNQLNANKSPEDTIATYPGFFPEPGKELVFQEQYNLAETNDGRLICEVKGIKNNSLQQTETIAAYLSEKLSDKMDIPEDMIEDLPQSVREKVLQKKNKKIEILSDKIDCTVTGTIQFKDAAGTVSALDCSVTCNYMKRYQKEYSISLKNCSNE